MKRSNLHRSLVMLLVLCLALSLCPVAIAVPGEDLSASQPIERAAVLPRWPVPGHTRLSQGFHGNNAIDISDGSIEGAQVIAAMGGKVTRIHLCGTQHYGNMHDCSGFGTGLVILGDDGRAYQYAHMQAGSIPSNVYYGCYVQRGQPIGRVGTTGNSSGSHLHFGISYTSNFMDAGPDPNPAYMQYDYTGVTVQPANLGADFFATIARADCGKLLTANAISTGSLVYLNDTTSDQTQCWHFVRQSDGAYRIFTMGNGYALNIDNGNKADGTAVNTWLDLGNAAQTWLLYPSGDGYRFISPYANKTITISANGTQNGSAAVISTDTGNADQIFAIRIHTHAGSFHNAFSDVQEGRFFYEPVMWAVNRRITTGVDDTHFAPYDACTRAQVVTFLWRAMGSPKPKTATNPFVDVARGKFYYEAVLWAAENSITNGTDATHFAPDVKVTRGQFVAFLWRAKGMPPTSAGNPFKDVVSGRFYYAAVLWAAENGITVGVTPTQFRPNDTCTRGQVVTFLSRDLQ